MTSKKVLAGVGLAALVGAFFVARARHAAPASDATAQPGIASGDAAALDASQVPGSGGAVTGTLRPATATNLDVRPLFDRTTRLAAGKPAKLRFAARSKSGFPAPSADVSISVLRPGHPEERLAASEVEHGVYEASFTPGGPGQYRLVVNSGGVPVASAPPVKVAVVGAVGADGPAVTDITNSTNFDPLTTRSKGTGRGRRR